MKLYVYRNQNINGDNFGPVVAVVEGKSNEECEAAFASLYDSNDYTAAYAPAIGDRS